MSTTSYIGRKVKLTEEYIKNNPLYIKDGINEGTVKNVDGHCWLVKMNNGETVAPFSPKHSEPQCILLEETNQEALDRLQLQPGDIVRVISNDNGIHGWVDPMEECMGKPQEVEEIDEEGIVSLWMSDKTKNFWYRPQILEVVSRAAGKQEPVQEPATDNHTILDTAKSLIYGDRLNDYGKTVDSFTSIGVGWSEITKTTLTPEQVGLMMIWLKICRANNDNCKKEDSIIDIAGYAGCIEKVKKGL